MTQPLPPTSASLATLETIIEVFHADRVAIARAVRRVPVEIANVGRADLPRLFRACGFMAGAEIGVKQGEFSEVLCDGVPGLRLYCVDPWRIYDGYLDFTDQRKLDKNYAETAARLARFNGTVMLTSAHAVLVRKFSIDAAKDFADGSLDFVYVDGNHSFAPFASDLDAWTPKIRSGGIISGHDYYRHAKPVRHCHVAECVDGWTEAWHIVPYFALGRRACDIPGEIRDRPRSWMFVKV